jgi:hypothetical protein
MIGARHVGSPHPCLHAEVTNAVELMISITRGHTHNVKLLNVWVFVALGRPWHCFGSHTFD